MHVSQSPFKMETIPQTFTKLEKLKKDIDALQEKIDEEEESKKLNVNHEFTSNTSMQQDRYNHDEVLSINSSKEVRYILIHILC